ncbi:MAG: hypothetical protein JOZ73_11960 [Solirubrobacterales bacterium]|nr:hypothetical protein [Solirubrobacterales bacterium]
MNKEIDRHGGRLVVLERFREGVEPTIETIKRRMTSLADAEARAREAERKFAELRSEAHNDNVAFLSQAKALLERTSAAAADKALEPLRPALATVQEIRDTQIAARALSDEAKRRAEETRAWREWVRPLLIQLLTTAGAVIAAYLATKGHQ